jgi:UDP-N-acetylmuramoylalanine--D-glutamate ligase
LSSSPNARTSLAGVQTALILGLGKVTGAAVADALLSEGIDVRIHESFPSDAHSAIAAGLTGRGAEVSFGELEQGAIEELVDWADLIVPSPGVPPANPLLAGALGRGRRVISEVELGYGYVRGPVLAVTGTNGKTTTTSLLASVLEHAGVPAVAAGNIGHPFVEAARTVPSQTALVCEVSSFQLAFIESFRAQIAIVLNVGDDHYDWHAGYEDYVAAKARITENQRPDDALIIRAGEPGCLAIAAGSAAETMGFGIDTPEEVRASLQLGLGRGVETVAGLVDDGIVIDSSGSEGALIKLEDIRLEGLHNVENVMAATLAAMRFGVALQVAAEAVSRFSSLPHRTELVREKDGVRYVDDSKATNPHATLRAMTGLENVVLIAGGRAKGLDLSVLEQVTPALAGVVVMGEAAGELRRIFAGVPLEVAGDIEVAVQAAASMAAPGATVLLSPACSSLDQYSSYAERGDRFRRAVEAL